MRGEVVFMADRGVGEVPGFWLSCLSGFERLWPGYYEGGGSYWAQQGEGNLEGGGIISLGTLTIDIPERRFHLTPNPFLPSPPSHTHTSLPNPFLSSSTDRAQLHENTAFNVLAQRHLGQWKGFWREVFQLWTRSRARYMCRTIVVWGPSNDEHWFTVKCVNFEIYKYRTVIYG